MFMSWATLERWQRPCGNSPSEHRNTLNSEPTEIYIKRDAEGNRLKTGISQKADDRYSSAEIDRGRVDVIGNRPRDKAAKLERFMVERKPGPDNNEWWAGKRDPTHENYDPNYVPPHMRD